MNNKKLTGQQIKFIINMCALALFVVSYLYIYDSYEKKTAAAKKETAVTRQAIDTAKEKIANEDSVKESTKKLKAEIDQIINGYPVNITKVDNLLFVEKMQKDLDIKFTNVNPSDSQAYFSTILPIRNEDGTEVDQTALAAANAALSPAPTDNSAAGTNTQAANTQTTGTQTTDTTATQDTTGTDTTTGADTAVGTDTTAGTDTSAGTGTTIDQSGAAGTGDASIVTMQGAQSTITMNFQVSYSKFKKMTEYIKNYPDKTVIDSVSVSYDATADTLTGVLVLKRFSLTGTGKTYEAPKIDDISIGTDNIFGSD